MLPTVNRGRGSASYRNNSVLPQYLRRIVKVKENKREMTCREMYVWGKLKESTMVNEFSSKRICMALQIKANVDTCRLFDIGF